MRCLTIFLIIILMGVVIWGLLEKSQTDDETIEEAIARLILVHEEDEASHLGIGESLQSHKASEIIDHAALSIISDKIKAREVSLSKLTDFGYERHSLSLESLDNWDTSGSINSMIGSVDLQPGPVINQVVWGRASTFDGISFARFFTAQFRFRYSYITNQLGYVGVGVIDPGASEFQYAAFKVSNGSLYAAWASGPLEEAVEHVIEITGIDLVENHLYRIEYFPSEKIDFYVDDVLKATATEDLIDTSWGGGPFTSLYLKNTAAATRLLVVTQIYFIQEF